MIRCIQVYDSIYSICYNMNSDEQYPMVPSARPNSWPMLVPRGRALLLTPLRVNAILAHIQHIYKICKVLDIAT